MTHSLTYARLRAMLVRFGPKVGDVFGGARCRPLCPFVALREEACPLVAVLVAWGEEVSGPARRCLVPLVVVALCRRVLLLSMSTARRQSPPQSAPAAGQDQAQRCEDRTADKAGSIRRERSTERAWAPAAAPSSVRDRDRSGQAPARTSSPTPRPRQPARGDEMLAAAHRERRRAVGELASGAAQLCLEAGIAKPQFLVTCMRK